MRLLLLLLFFICPNVLWGQRFEYPTPPDSIRDRQGRIIFMAEHFWNEPSINDTLNFKGPKLLLDYLYLLKQLDKEHRENCIGSFVSLASKRQDSFELIVYWFDNILYESASPHKDESIYLEFLDAVISSDVDSAMKVFPEERAKILRKNRIGTLANNFDFVEKTGNQTDLYHIEAPLLLVIFNNPDCSLCHHNEQKIIHNEMIQALISNGELKVLAITPDADYDEWLKHEYPSNWVTGFDHEKQIYNHQLYNIQQFPSMYLLDKDKRVILKDIDYEKVCNYIEKTLPILKNQDNNCEEKLK